MKSQNFEFVRTRRPEIATLGAFAERYAITDPSSALVKLRTLVEQLVENVYDEQRLPKPYRSGLYDLLNERVFTDLVPQVVQQKIHTIRVRGNKAAHGEHPHTDLVLSLIHEAFDVVSWFHLTFDGGDPTGIPSFEAPSASQEESKGKLKREKKALLEKLARQELELQELLDRLEGERKKREELERAREDELVAVRKAGEQRAKELAFSEAETRKFLIDAMLVSAGWDVGKDGTNTEEVGQEVPLFGLPTPSGEGFADYVLWGEDGKPLAVVEAKKTAKDARAGRTQAQQYADSLEVAHGQRPVIFYTNGVDLFIWDDGPTRTRSQGAPPRRIYGFYSKDSLDYVIFQRSQAERLENVPADKDIAGRMYQLEAVRRVAERFADGHRRALIVQATGTGKTRVAVSLCELLSRAKWAKRILFLCDRRELRKQADQVFKEFLPGEPRVFVSAKTASDREKRIYLATYPAMMSSIKRKSTRLPKRFFVTYKRLKMKFNLNWLSWKGCCYERCSGRMAF